jgi:3-phenylpropionate/trans-cinnamate dioxygenase ferredoxin subunit
MPEKWIALTPLTELEEGKVRVFKAGDVEIALCKVNGEIYAVENICSHDDGPLGEGTLDGAEIECPRHGARFDVRDGRVRRMPASAPIRTFPVRVENDQVCIALSEETE